MKEPDKNLEIGDELRTAKETGSKDGLKSNQGLEAEEDIKGNQGLGADKGSGEDKSLADKADKEILEKRKFYVSFIKFVSSFFTTLLVVFFVFVVYSAIRGWGSNGISVGPFRIFNIISGSMEPTISVGDIVLTQSVSKDELHVGDVITFRASENSETMVTHRIISQADDEDEFITQGDINERADPPVHFDNIAGKVIFRLPFLGMLISIGSTSGGLALIVIVFILLMILIEIVKRIIKN